MYERAYTVQVLSRELFSAARVWNSERGGNERVWRTTSRRQTTARARRTRTETSLRMINGRDINFATRRDTHRTRALSAPARGKNAPNYLEPVRAIDRARTTK